MSTASERGRPGLSGAFASFFFSFLFWGFFLTGTSTHFSSLLKAFCLFSCGFLVFGSSGLQVRSTSSRLWQSVATLIYDFLAFRRAHLLDRRDHPGTQVVLEVLGVFISILHANFQRLKCLQRVMDSIPNGEKNIFLRFVKTVHLFQCRYYLLYLYYILLSKFEASIIIPTFS